jgi:uncharacterized protein
MSHHRINYIEFPCYDLAKTRDFYQTVFGWVFQMYGPEYMGFRDAANAETEQGGFFQIDAKQPVSQTQNGAVLVVLYSNDLEASYAAVTQNGGRIAKEIFEFPGGRRFHFFDPSGNELAVWKAS